MTILAFDSCFSAVSAAVSRPAGDGGSVVHECFERLEKGHAERLLPMIEEVMAAAGVGWSGIERIAVTNGPGGFTGVRACVAVARALALAAGKPLVVIGSLEAIGHRACEMLGERRGGREVVVAMDARKGALYLQRFADAADAAGGGRRGPLLFGVGEAAAMLRETEAVVVGSGAAALAAAAGAEALLAVELTELQPHARTLAMLGAGLAVVDTVRPRYVRAADARPQEGKSLPRASR